MNLDSITVELLEETLKALKKSDPRRLPADLLNLTFLETSPNLNSQSREDLLYEQLEKIAFKMLGEHRRNTDARLSLAVTRPTSREDALRDIKADFSCGNAELEAWSTVYHLYLTPPGFNLGVSILANEVMAPQTRDKQSQFRRRVKDGLARFVARLKQAEAQARQRSRELHLPAPEYNQLFGVESIIREITNWLKEPDKLFVSIEGLGGWGKTALARAVAGEFLKNNSATDIVWVSARHEKLDLDADGKISQLQDPARSTDDIISHLTEKLIPGQASGLSRQGKIERLQLVLSNQSYLVVIDNLENVSDSEALMPAIFPLAGKTRFLLTSRAPLGKFPYVSCYRVPELSRSHSFALLQNELGRKGRQAAYSNEDMNKIYDLIGGVPLALKLVASHLQGFSLSHTLDGLREAREHPERMYTYIYRRTWQKLLDEPARQLLLCLQYISPDGEDEAWIQEHSPLSQAAFDAALKRLLDCALLEITGPLEKPLYHLHRLTITFLQSDILFGWQE